MSVATEITLNKFRPRPFQIPLLDAIINKNYKRALIIWPRRAGKDITCFNLAIRQCLSKTMVCYYIFPTFAQAKRVIWDSITNTGERILDYIPKELVTSMNGQSMSIRFVNGSLLQLVGSDNYDALMGTNPKLCIFSEYALQDPRAYQYIRPILTANDGAAVFVSTPRGKNHLWELYQIAQQNDNWFCQKLTIEDTGHISLYDIEKEKHEGIMSDDLIQQEYYTSFDMGIEGSYYAKYIDKMRVKGQIGVVPHEEGFKVNTAWDLGVRDSTTIIFFQTVGQIVRIIGCYENSKVGLEFYAKILQQRANDEGYVYGKHIAPHDIAVKELGSGMTRLEKARQLGITFVVAPNISIEDGIESVRSALSKIWIDAVSCAPMIKAIENYRQEYDVRNKVYKGHPLHDWSSHWCFTGSTKILTHSGIQSIMDIGDNVKVLTLNGWKSCTPAMLIKKDAPLVEVAFKGGMTVKCTPDHLFLTENGWLSAESLQRDMQIQSSLMNLPNISMALYTESMGVNDISHGEDLGFIETFGEKLLGPFQMVATFITKTATQLITIFGTLSAFLKRFILGRSAQTTEDLALRHEMQPMNGIDPRPAYCGTRDMLSESKVGLSGHESHEPVYCAKKNLCASLEKMGMNKNSAMPIVRQPIIEGVRSLKETADVYCIGVPDAGHFSLANGAIVKNCDALRYMCVSLPKTRDGLSPEELDKRYYESMNNTNPMPRFFRDDH